MEYSGACKFCGQIKMIRGGEGMTIDEVDREATLECDCPEATFMRNVDKKMRYAEGNIRELLAEDGEMIMGCCRGLLQALAEQQILKVTIQTGTGIRISMQGKERAIKITRRETIEKSMEGTL